MNIQAYQTLFSQLQTTLSKEYLQFLRSEVEQVYLQPKHGHFNQWKQIIKDLPAVKSEYSDFTHNVISIGQGEELSHQQLSMLHTSLLQLSPWRKGPFRLFGIDIDSEWRSDMKWDRLCKRLPSLQGANILDVGCGNGYFLLRMIGAGARCVVGVDPSLLFVAQFQAITQFLNTPPNAHILPLRYEQICTKCTAFDFVFSMGVLYHRRDPVEHLHNLKKMLKPGGQLILETIILNSGESEYLIPEDRYAGMRNVWSIPKPSQLERWLDEAGWSDIECIHLEKTREQEQRSTDWMPSFSLTNFLDPHNPDFTIEGHPAPVRGVWFARK